jgi:hypothetical protein
VKRRGLRWMLRRFGKWSFWLAGAFAVIGGWSLGQYLSGHGPSWQAVEACAAACVVFLVISVCCNLAVLGS